MEKICINNDLFLRRMVDKSSISYQIEYMWNTYTAYISMSEMGFAPTIILSGQYRSTALPHEAYFMRNICPLVSDDIKRGERQYQPSDALVKYMTYNLQYRVPELERRILGHPILWSSYEMNLDWLESNSKALGIR